VILSTAGIKSEPNSVDSFIFLHELEKINKLNTDIEERKKENVFFTNID
jgi:hypothetical protein